MMRRVINLFSLFVCMTLTCSCTDTDTLFSSRPIETGFSFTNLSQRAYAQLEIRANGLAENDFYKTPLLAPGVTHRERFLDSINVACPASVDLRLFLFERINPELPIGLDFGEEVGMTPTVAGETFNVPACANVVVETYTIVNWDAPLGAARVKIAQGTPLESVIRSSELFANPEAVWEMEGQSPGLEEVPPQALASSESIDGRVVLADGSGLESIGVLIRTRFRTRLSDEDETNDPDVGFGEPIDFTVTDANGAFRFARPGGAYRIEVFSDDFLFRPAIVDLETPSDTLVFVAELAP